GGLRQLILTTPGLNSRRGSTFRDGRSGGTRRSGAHARRGGGLVSFVASQRPGRLQSRAGRFAAAFVLGLTTGPAGGRGAPPAQLARQDAALADLRAGIDGLRTDLRGLRTEVTALRTTLEAGLGRAAATQESDQAIAREAGEGLAGRLAQP